jgi:hypothetical protein
LCLLVRQTLLRSAVHKLPGLCFGMPTRLSRRLRRAHLHDDGLAREVGEDPAAPSSVQTEEQAHLVGGVASGGDEDPAAQLLVQTDGQALLHGGDGVCGANVGISIRANDLVLGANLGSTPDSTKSNQPPVDSGVSDCSLLTSLVARVSDLDKNMAQAATYIQVLVTVNEKLNGRVVALEQRLTAAEEKFALAHHVGGGAKSPSNLRQVAHDPVSMPKGRGLGMLFPQEASGCLIGLKDSSLNGLRVRCSGTDKDSGRFLAWTVADAAGPARGLKVKEENFQWNGRCPVCGSEVISYTCFVCMYGLKKGSPCVLGHAEFLRDESLSEELVVSTSECIDPCTGTSIKNDCCSPLPVASEDGSFIVGPSGSNCSTVRSRTMTSDDCTVPDQPESDAESVSSPLPSCVRGHHQARESFRSDFVDH